MTVWLLLPLVLSALFGLAAPALGRRLPPHLATWLLSAGAVLVAAASSASIALLAFVFLAQSPVLVAQGHWSDEVLRGHDQLAGPIGVSACAAVVVLSLRFLQSGRRRLTALRDANQLARALPNPTAELAVIDVPARQALAVPGRPGRIVATTGILRSLDAAQRRALLAHERAHLAHRHHVHQTAAALAVSINPLLGRLRGALALSCERWADEDAAAASDRRSVAEALTRAASSGRTGVSEVALAAASADVADRVDALFAAPLRPSVWRLAALSALLLATAAAVAIAMHDVERLFEHAQLAYQLGRR